MSPPISLTLVQPAGDAHLVFREITQRKLLWKWRYGKAYVWELLARWDNSDFSRYLECWVLSPQCQISEWFYVVLVNILPHVVICGA